MHMAAFRLCTDMTKTAGGRGNQEMERERQTDRHRDRECVRASSPGCLITLFFIISTYPIMKASLL